MIRFRLNIQAPIETLADGLETNVRKTLLDVARDMAKDIRGRVRKDTGALQRNIRAQQPAQGMTASVVSTLVQGVIEEVGRRAGARMPPRGVLLGWLDRHNIPRGREYVIRRAISRRGIAARHTFENTLRENADRIARRVMDAFGAVVEK